MSERTYETEAPRCPHCQHLHQHDGGYFYDDMLTELECEACGKVSQMSVYTSTTWTCEPFEETETTPAWVKSDD